MKLIVGLGNPGEKYQHNRHNVGFMFVNYLLSLQEPQAIVEVERDVTISGFKYDKYMKSEVAKTKINNQEVILIKPQTYMNKSGEAVKKTVSSWQLVVSNLIVVHDDLDIPLGKFKIQLGTGPKLHNGISSIENHLKTKDFLRVRIGVDNRPANSGVPGETYVLHDFTQEEKEIINNVFSQISSRLFEPPYSNLVD